MAQHLVALGSVFEELDPLPAEPLPTPQEETQLALWQSLLEAVFELRELVAQGVKPPKVPAPRVTIDVPSADEIGRAVASSIKLPAPPSAASMAAAIRENLPDQKMLRDLIEAHKNELDEVLRRLKKLPVLLAGVPPPNDLVSRPEREVGIVTDPATEALLVEFRNRYDAVLTATPATYTTSGPHVLVACPAGQRLRTTRIYVQAKAALADGVVVVRAELGSNAYEMELTGSQPMMISEVWEGAVDDDLVVDTSSTAAVMANASYRVF